MLANEIASYVVLSGGSMSPHSFNLGAQVSGPRVVAPATASCRYFVLLVRNTVALQVNFVCARRF
jgi:hypothetical protein